MNELLKKIRTKLAASSAATRAFYARNKMLVLGGLTMLSILLIVWARLGFTFEIGHFFAANDLPPGAVCDADSDCDTGACDKLPLSPLGTCGLGGLPAGAPCTGDSSCGSRNCVKPPLSPLGACGGGAPDTPKIFCAGPNLKTAGPLIAGQVISFDATLGCGGGAGARCDKVKSAWVMDFGDATIPKGSCGGPGTGYGGCGSSVTHSYKGPGTFTVKLICDALCESPALCAPYHEEKSLSVTIIAAPTSGTTSPTTGNGGEDTGGGNTGGGNTGGGSAATPPSPGTLRLDSCANGTARLSWTPGANANENLLRRIYTDNTNSWQQLVNDAGTTSYTDTIPAGISYNYQVKSDPNTVSNTVTCANVASAVTPTPGPNDPGVGMLAAPCTGGATPSITVRWSKSPPPGSAGPFNAGNSATLNRSVSGTTQQTSPPAADKGTYWEWVDTGVPSGASVLYRGKYGADAGTNTVEFVASPAKCGAATPTPTTLPVDAPVICAPAEQTVAVNQSARLTATGGSDSYRWASDKQTEQGASATFTYATTGSKTVTVNSGTSTADCLVVVQAAAAPAMTLTVLGRNISSGGPEGLTVGALGEQQVEVVVRVRNSSAEANLANILARSALPPGLVYIADSTTVNNAPVTVESITAGGLSIGSLGPSQEAIVRFRTRVNGASFPVGTTQASIVTQVSADGAGERSGSVVVSVSRAAVGVAPPAAVPTGPGEAVLVALLVSGIVTMLYVSYTHSPFFRRHEAEALSEDQGPMDFRG